MMLKMPTLLSSINLFYLVFANVKTKPTEPNPTLQPNLTHLDSFENATFNFDCANRAVGFYADQEYNCQIFHMCDGESRRIPHICADETSFNQEFRICDWIYNFDCSEAHKWYYLNELTYESDVPKEKEVES